MEEMLIGFTARLDWSEFKVPFADYWINSVDSRHWVSLNTSIWLSLFDGDGLAIGTVVPERPSLPKWIGIASGLWEDLERLTSYIKEQRVSYKYHLIAVETYWASDTLVEDNYFLSLASHFHITPSQRSPEWQLLGYEVGNCWLETSMEVIFMEQSLFDEWSPYLNDLLLFSNIEAAFRFRD